MSKLSTTACQSVRFKGISVVTAAAGIGLKADKDSEAAPARSLLVLKAGVSMRTVVSYLLIVALCLSGPVSLKAQENNSSSYGYSAWTGEEPTSRFSEWFRKFQEKQSERQSQSGPQQSQNEGQKQKNDAGDQSEALMASKAQSAVQQSLILAVQQVVKEKLSSAIENQVSHLYEKYGDYISSPSHAENYSHYSIDQLARKLFSTSYQEILERAHGMATGNLAKWSAEAHRHSPQRFRTEYSLYDLMIGEVKKNFERARQPEQAKIAAAEVLALIQSSITNQLQRVAALRFTGGNTEARDIVSFKGNSSSASGSDSKATFPGGKTNVIIDMSEGSAKVSSEFTSATVEIPEVNMSEVYEQNPETLKYKLRKPVAGITHFGHHYLLFNIPLAIITVALVGLDQAKNPLVLDQFEKSLSNPVVAMGFGLFMLTQHRTAIGFQKVVTNPQLRFLAGPMGMAAGMLAQSVFTDLWNDQDIRACARSHYDPKMKSGDHCTKAWNKWILTNKISQYVPAILGLLSTAFAAGYLQKFGGAAIGIAGQKLVDAEQEVAALMKQMVEEDPMVQKAKRGAEKAKAVGKAGVNKAKELANRALSKPQLQSLLQQAKLRVENAKTELELAKQFAQEFKDKLGGRWAGSMGRLNVRIKGIWAISRDAFKSGPELEAYLLKLKKLKGFVNISLVSLGANLVFLALDPFISEPLNEVVNKKTLADFNIKQNLENVGVVDNMMEIVSAFFSHKIQLPHEKDFQTTRDIFSAYQTSLDHILKNNFLGYELTKCYAQDDKGDGSKEEQATSTELPSWTPKFLKPSLQAVTNGFDRSKEWLIASNSAVKRYLVNQGLYFLDPECVVKSDFRQWLDKYADVEKGWRMTLLTQVMSSNAAWSETISNFVINYDTTKTFYSYIANLINDYREELDDKGSANLPTAEIERKALIAAVREVSKVPHRSQWSDQDKPRFESLYADSIGDFDTPEYADFLVASMACGPDPRQPVSFMQNLKSLSWFPWESISHLAPSIFSTWQTVKPNSPLIETYPGTSFKYHPPRLTNGDPEKLCDKSRWLAPPSRIKEVSSKSAPKIYYQQLRIDDKAYANLLEYIFKNPRQEILQTEEPVDQFFLWNRETSTNPIYDEKVGVWPVVKRNYENLMKHHFFPALKDTSMETACPGGGIHCAFTDDTYLRANGLVYSAMNEMYTYVRTLRKILLHVQQLSEDIGQGAGLNFYNQGKADPKKPFRFSREVVPSFKGEFDEITHELIFSLLDKSTKPDQFDFNDAREKIARLHLGIFRSLPDTDSGLAAMQLIESVVGKMVNVVGELEGYKQYSSLTFKKGELKSESQTSNKPGNAYDPRFKGPSAR